MFDIKKLAIQDSAQYTVTDAAGDPQYDEQDNPITITVASPGTKKAVRAQFKRDEARSARVIGQMGGKTSKRTENDDLAERADFLAAVTESLDGFDFPGGPRALYMDPTLGHIADGVEKFYNDRGNFSAKSPTNSSNTSDTQLG